MPDDNEDGAADRDHRAFLAAPLGDAPISFAQEGVGSAGDDRGLAEGAGQVAVDVPGGSVAFGLAGGTVDAGGKLGPRTQVPRGREPRHIQPDLGDDGAGRDWSDAGY